MAKKCGSCAFFQVRNADEARLAQIAKNESECAPGEWVFRGERKVGCHGGPVRGLCLQFGKQVFSTQVCPKYKAGGPVLRRAGSPNKSNSSPVDGTIMAGTVVAMLALAGWIKERIK